MDVFINDIAAFLPNDPVTNDEIEEVLGKIHDVRSRVKSRVLKNNGIRTRYYSIDRTTGDETYDIYFEVDTSSAFSSAVEVARVKGITAVGYYEVLVSSQLIEALEPGATHIRAKVDVGGTTPSINYGAWMTFHGI